MGQLPEARSVRLQVMLDSSEIEAIDKWRFAKRMPSRAATIRELLRRGLASDRALRRLIKIGLKAKKR
jgi:hypothetical protein